MGTVFGYSFSLSDSSNGKQLRLVVQHNGRNLGEQFALAVEKTQSELIVDSKYVGVPLKIKDAEGHETWVKIDKSDLKTKFHFEKAELKELETSDQLENCMLEHLTQLLMFDKDFKKDSESAIKMLPKDFDDIPKEFLNTPNTELNVKSNEIFLAEKPPVNKHLAKKIFSKISKSVVSEFQNLSTSRVFMRYGKQIKDKEFLLRIEKGKSFEQKEKEIYQNVKDPRQVAKDLKSLNMEKERFNNIQKRRQFSETTKKDLEILGGKKIALMTHDHVKLDAMYLDTNQFKKMLKEAGGTLITYNAKLENSEERKFQAIALSKKELGDQENILTALNRLSEVKDMYGNILSGFVWKPVEVEDKILLMRAEEIELNKPIINWDFKKQRFSLTLPSNAQLEKIEQKIPVGEAAGTVVLSSGALGLYENVAHSDALFFLFKNMNVVLFNFRGYGESDGVPSKKGLKIDMESAYQLALKKSGQQPNKILFKALCMSGGPAAYVAGQHPETNIFLDQSYSGFRKLAKQNIRHKFNQFFSTGALKFTGNMGKFLASCISGIINLFVHYTIPDYNVAKYLAKNKGKKGLLYAKEDQIISIDHIENNLKAIAQAQEIQNTLVFSIQGNHDQSLIQIQSSPFSHFSQKEQEKIQDLIDVKIKLEKELEQKKKDLKGEEQLDLQNLEKKIILLASKIINLLPTGITLKNLKETEMNGQKQLSFFLSKAGLSEDLIKPVNKLIV